MSTVAPRSRPLPVAGIGLVAGVMSVAVTLSFAALLFAGMGPDAFARGAGFLLLGNMAANLIASRWASMPGALVIPQDTSTAILATTSAPLLAGLAVDMRFATLLLYVALSSVLTGVVMLLIGLMRQGSLVRFIPLPVIGGFLSGTGYLLVVGGADVMTSGFDWDRVPMAALAGGSLFALAMLLALRAWPRPVLLPAGVAAGTVLFFVVLALIGVSFDEARALGLLMEPVATKLSLPFSELRSVGWSLLGSGWGGLATVPLVATLGMLLNVNALETLGNQDADLDRELRMVGTANIAAAGAATPAIYHTLGLSALGYRVGVRSRAVPVIVAATCLAVAWFGGPVLAFLPLPVIGGLIMFIGLGFITDWFVDRRRQMTGPEVLLMLAIVFAVATLGFLVAVAFGVLAALVIFAIRYSAIDPIRHHALGTELRSSVDRPRAAEAVLAARGDRILIVQLHGFLFFGTAKLAVDRVMAMIEEAEPVEVIVVDLERVTGADATGVSAIAKLGAICLRHADAVFLSTVPEGLLKELQLALDEGVRLLADLDHALEEAEEFVIGGRANPDACGLDEVFGSDVWERLRPYMERVRVAADDIVIREGDTGSGVLLVEEGRLVTEIAVADGYRRVRSSGPGAIVGEMSLYRDAGRSARVFAAEPSVLLSLDAEAIAAIDAEDPELAVRLHRVMAAVMAERVAQGNVAVATLLR